MKYVVKFTGQFKKDLKAIFQLAHNEKRSGGEPERFSKEVVYDDLMGKNNKEG